MTNYEMVELLRQKANVSYEEAKAALEAANWDLLDAIVLLEREGKVPENDARFSTKAEEKAAEEGKKKKDRDGAFKDGARTVGGISAACSTTATATTSSPRAMARRSSPCR